MALKVTSLGSLVKRAENETVPYTSGAITCADSKDSAGNVTMTEVFEAIVSASQNISHMCTSTNSTGK